MENPKKTFAKLKASLLGLSKRPLRMALVILAIPVIAVLVFVLYRVSDNISDNIRYNTGEKNRVSDLKAQFEAGKKRWYAAGVDSYVLTIEISAGGQVTWEGREGQSSGAESKRTYEITIVNNENTSMKEITSPAVINLDGKPFIDSILDLFEIVGNLLDLPDNAVNLPIETGPGEKISVPVENEKQRLKYHAEFDSTYGYPTLIYLYFQSGNYEKFVRDYVVIYQIMSFEKMD